MEYFLKATISFRAAIKSYCPDGLKTLDEVRKESDGMINSFDKEEYFDERDYWE